MKKMPFPGTRITPEMSGFLQEITGNRVFENSGFLSSHNKINKLDRKSGNRRAPDLGSCGFLRNVSDFIRLRRNPETGFSYPKGVGVLPAKRGRDTTYPGAGLSAVSLKRAIRSVQHIHPTTMASTAKHQSHRRLPPRAANQKGNHSWLIQL
jgi:hypothetical protein